MRILITTLTLLCLSSVLSAQSRFSNVKSYFCKVTETNLTEGAFDYMCLRIGVVDQMSTQIKYDQIRFIQGQESDLCKGAFFGGAPHYLVKSLSDFRSTYGELFLKELQGDGIDINLIADAPKPSFISDRSAYSITSISPDALDQNHVPTGVANMKVDWSFKVGTKYKLDCVFRGEDY